MKSGKGKKEEEENKEREKMNEKWANEGVIVHRERASRINEERKQTSEL